MFFNRKQTYRVRLLLTIRTTETEHPVDNPDGVRPLDPKYFRQWYYRFLEMPYPPVMGMMFVGHGEWSNSKVIGIRYDDENDITQCILEDVVYDYHALMIAYKSKIREAMWADGWIPATFPPEDDPLIYGDDELENSDDR